MTTAVVKERATTKQMLSPEQREELQKFQEFTKVLSKKPNEKRVRTNKFANNSLFLSIADIEMQLDRMFFGLWQTHTFTTKIVANEICGEIVLEVFHPIAQVWMRRVGAAAVQIQMSVQRDPQGNKLPPDITDVSKKIVNTLTKDYPHLKSECIKNAAKSLGKYFGRDLNRTDAPDYAEAIQTKDAHEDLKK